VKRKILSISFALVLALSLILVTAVPAAANSVASSTIVFQASSSYPLTYSGGIYSGVIPCKVDGGYDIYAREGATAYFSEDDNVTIANHDAWPTWDPNTPDWYQYSLNLYEEDGVQKWAIRNHPSATEAHPWYDTTHWGAEKPACGVPMSGTMDWNAMYAMETNVGAYLEGTGSPLHDGWAEGNGGGAGYWDMDWSWGSEAVPLQYPGFDVEVTGSSPNYTVTFTPAAAGSTQLTVDVPDIVAISVDPTSIDFGSMVPGQTSSPYAITVTNVGTHQADVEVQLDASSADLFKENLWMRYDSTGSFNTGSGSPFYTWGTLISGLNMNASSYVETELSIPSDYTPDGEETATLIFTATGT
jgi:hypothetical protein